MDKQSKDERILLLSYAIKGATQCLEQWQTELGELTKVRRGWGGRRNLGMQLKIKTRKLRTAKPKPTPIRKAWSVRKRKLHGEMMRARWAAARKEGRTTLAVAS